MLLSELKAFINTNRKKGRREAFGLAVQSDDTYLAWAFAFDYLFVVKENFRITGCGVAYPLGKPYSGDVKALFAFGKPVPRDSEGSCDICIMDWIAVTGNARRELVRLFKARYKNWDKQRKWGLHDDVPREFSNKYLNHLETL